MRFRHWQWWVLAALIVVVAPILWDLDRHLQAYYVALVAAFAIAAPRLLSKPLAGRVLTLAECAFALFLAYGLYQALIDPSWYNPQQWQRGGFDRDDALRLGAQALMDGENPYELRTYKGNEITPLPGAFVLAMPFVAMGHVVLHAFFWMAAGLLVARRAFGRQATVVVLMSVVFLAHGISERLKVGDDLASNAIYVAIAALGLVHMARSRWAWAWAAFLGLALATRLNFLLLAPVLLALLRHEVGWRRALALASVAAIVFAALVLPVAFLGEDSTHPLQAQAGKGGYGGVLGQVERAVAVLLVCAPGIAAFALRIDRAKALWLMALSQAMWAAIFVAKTLMHPELIGYVLPGDSPRVLLHYALSEGYFTAALVFAAIACAAPASRGTWSNDGPTQDPAPGPGAGTDAAARPETRPGA